MESINGLSRGLLSSVEAYVERRFGSEMQEHLYYHNPEHTRRVVAAVMEIGPACGLQGELLEDVIIAAWFHDLGYLKKYVGHEEESGYMAERFLNEIQLQPDRIRRISRLIIATKFRHHPSDLPEKVLIDADRFAMGDNQFISLGEDLRKEWAHYLKKNYTDLEWTKVQLQYLAETEFFTDYARKTYGKERQHNIRRLQAILGSLQSDHLLWKKRWQRKFQAIQRWLIGFIGVLSLGLGVGFSLSLAVWGMHDESLICGFLSGLMISLGLRLFDSAFERYIIRKMSFLFSLIFGTAGLMLLFLGSQALALSALYFVPEYFSILHISPVNIQEGYQTLLSYDALILMSWSALLISVILNFIKLTGRIVGPRVLWNYVRGRYFKPIREERIFMFVDLNSSTRLAETMELTQYHLLLSTFFKDVASPISRSNGEIYQYVGDEVVISWSMKEGLRNSNCIRCYFRIQKQIEKSSQYYIQKFGFVPDFKVALHGGTVIAGEVGKYRTDIVFHGKVLNTTERILNQCKPLDKKVLISEYLLRRLDLLPGIQPRYVASLLLKGKENEISLYTLEKI